MSKEQLERKLWLMGATKDDTVANIWWLNGHCIRVIKEKEGDGYTLDEL